MSCSLISTLRLGQLFVLFVALSLMLSAQAVDPNSILLFPGPNGTGAGQPIPIGAYKVDGKQLAADVKTAAFSVKVPKSIKVAFCEAVVPGSLVECELFSEGTHNLKRLAFVKIEVWKDTSEQYVPTVIVFEAPNWMGRSQVFKPGMYRSDRSEFGKINDNMAMSVIVAKGFLARFCQSEGEWGRGSDGCEEHKEGRHNIRLADSISFIEVIDLSDTSPPPDKMPVTLYEDADQGRKMQGFDIGTFVAGKGTFGKVLNDTASSIRIKEGYRVSVCSDEIPGDRCEELGPGKHNLKLKDSASYLRVWKP